MIEYTARQAFEELPGAVAQCRRLGLDEPSLLTLCLCTSYVYIGVAELGIPIHSLATLMLREDCPHDLEPSWLELQVYECARKCGAGIQMCQDGSQRRECVVEGDGMKGLRADECVGKFTTVVRARLIDAARPYGLLWKLLSNNPSGLRPDHRGKHVAFPAMFQTCILRRI